MNIEQVKNELRSVIVRYKNRTEFTGEVCRDIMARDCLNAIEELQAENERLSREQKQMEVQDQVVFDALRKENERLKAFCNELNKDCKWLPTSNTPTINGFETMVQCTNGKKRVASFRMFDMKWYDVNNGNKLNVIKWLWQPSMPQATETIIKVG